MIVTTPNTDGNEEAFKLLSNSFKTQSQDTNPECSQSLWVGLSFFQCLEWKANVSQLHTQQHLCSFKNCITPSSMIAACMWKSENNFVVLSFNLHVDSRYYTHVSMSGWPLPTKPFYQPSLFLTTTLWSTIQTKPNLPETGVTTQQIRVLAVLPEDASLISSSCSRSSNADALFWPPQAIDTYGVHRHNVQVKHTYT